jgi:hypothetical protein
MSGNYLSAKIVEMGTFASEYSRLQISYVVVFPKSVSSCDVGWHYPITELLLFFRYQLGLRSVRGRCVIWTHSFTER